MWGGISWSDIIKLFLISIYYYWNIISMVNKNKLSHTHPLVLQREEGGGGEAREYALYKRTASLFNASLSIMRFYYLLLLFFLLIVIVMVYFFITYFYLITSQVTQANIKCGRKNYVNGNSLFLQKTIKKNKFQ